MNCCAQPCRKITHVANCIDEENPLLIGTIEDVLTNVVVFAMNIATQRIDQYAATSSASGVVELEEDVRFVSLSPMRFFIRLQSELQGDNVIIDNEYECVEITFGAIK